MKSVAMLFPDELYEVMLKARFNERHNSVSEFVREAIKTYLRNTGYELPEFEPVKRGYPSGVRSGKFEPPPNLAEAIETYVAPKEPSAAWGETKGWNKE